MKEPTAPPYPSPQGGHRSAKHHQWLTEDIGHPALAQHLYTVVGLMRIAHSWAEFKGLLDRAYPKRGDTLPMDLFTESASEGWVRTMSFGSILHGGFFCLPDTVDPRPAKGDNKTRKGTWIMWSHLSSDNPAAPREGFWPVTLSTSTGSLREKEVCEGAARESTREWTNGQYNYRQRFVCLPDSVDPRRPKR